jgi:two-component system nitrate/nitrite response regulator NarL
MYILLIDDHTLFREALLHVLDQLGPKTFVLEASNAEEAIQLIRRASELDLILLDIDLPNVDGLTVLPILRELIPTTPVVVLSGSESALHVNQSIEKGAVGYIPKSCSSHEMLAALQIVLQGELYIPPKLLVKLSDTVSGAEIKHNDNDSPHGLTDRQIEVLVRIAQGLPNKTIARQLNVAEGTVKLHVAAILRQLGASNRTEAVMKASQLGLLSANVNR